MVCETYFVVTRATQLPFRYSVLVTLAALMWLLVIIRFIRESLQTYKITKHFQITHCLSHLTRVGMFYFPPYVHVLSFHLFPLLCYGANG